MEPAKASDSKAGRAIPGSVSRALVLLVAVVLVPLLLVQTRIYWGWFSSRMREEYQGNLEIARAVAASFEAYLRDVRRQELALAAALEGLRPYTDGQANLVLQAGVREHPSVRSWNWVSPEGEIILSSEPKAIGQKVVDRGYFREIVAGRDWAVTDLLVGRATGLPTFFVARRVNDAQGRLAGLMTAAVEPAQLNDLALPIRQTEGGGFTVVDRTGRVVYSALGEGAKRVNWLRDDPMLAAALAGKEQVGTFVCSADGARQIAAQVPMESVNPPGAGAPYWVAVASRPEAEAMAAVYEGLWLVVLGNVAVIAGSLVGGRFIARSITAPLLRLCRHAQAIGAGDLARRTEIRSVRELGEVADGLNRMAADLQAARRQQEEAQAGLEQANRQLQREIEERKQAAEALRRTDEELRRSNEDLEQFAYVSSHDLQEPLRAVTGYVQLLQRRYEGKLDKEADQYIAFAVDGATRMRQLINDLLSYSRVGSRGKPFAAVDMEETLRESQEALQQAIADSEAVITHDPLPTIQGDKTEMRQVMQNLIANAIKFRGADPPAIHVSARPEGEQWVFSVRDNGIGIDPKHWERVFVIFQRLHSRRLYEGTGIGLAICRKIVERHGGRIWLESQVGKGTTFYFNV